MFIRFIIITFKNKLSTKNITKEFWIIADREDFKPLRKITIKNNKENKTTVRKKEEIEENLLNDKESYYKNKHFANIQIWFNDDLLESIDNKNLSDIKDNKLVSIIIMIHLLNDNGKFTNNKNNIWSIKVTYTVDDFLNLKLDLDNVNSLMRIVRDKFAISDLIGGVSYKTLKTKLQKMANE